MLTDTTIKSAKPKDKPYKLFDARGLFLLVSPTGSRGWRLRYQFGGREKLISLGAYPDVPLKMARSKRDAARQLLAQDPPVDPSAKRKAERRAQEHSFESVARDWIEREEKARAAKAVKEGRSLPDTIPLMRRRLERYIFPHIGKMAIASITAPDLLPALKRIEARGRYETAKRTRASCGRIFRWAIANGLASHDPAADCRDALTTVEATNFAALTEPKRVGELLRAIDGYHGQPTVMSALKLAPLVFVRPGEIRAAEWSEFDLDAAEWRIRPERTKLNRAHLVPLSRQAVAILQDLHEITGGGLYLFPGLRSRKRPMSDNTLNAALRRLGFDKSEQTAHGFRSIASTLLNELGWNSDLIELQLAHKSRDKVRAAYNRAERVAERKEMMQSWADYLDTLRDGTSNVTALRPRQRQGAA